MLKSLLVPPGRRAALVVFQSGRGDLPPERGHETVGQRPGFPKAWPRTRGVFLLLNSSRWLDLQETKCLEHIRLAFHRTNAADL